MIRGRLALVSFFDMPAPQALQRSSPEKIRFGRAFARPRPVTNQQLEIDRTVCRRELEKANLKRRRAISRVAIAP
jgi:hypothetical protein